MSGVRTKPPKEIRYVSVECNSFIKSPRQIKCCLVTIYIQVHISECEEIKKDSMFKLILFAIKKNYNMHDRVLCS